MPDPVLLDRMGDLVAVVTLYRPPARNAVDPALAMRESPAVARLTPDAGEAASRPASASARARGQTSEDCREGPRAVIETRPPRWTGR